MNKSVNIHIYTIQHHMFVVMRIDFILTKLRFYFALNNYAALVVVLVEADGHIGHFKESIVWRGYLRLCHFSVRSYED